MSRIALLSLLSLILASFACNRPPDAKPAMTSAAPRPHTLAAQPQQDVDADNLLNMAYGAAVVSRTGELNLEMSAVHAIDGIFSSQWSSPPEDPKQTLVFSLAGPVRIERLGALTTPGTPPALRFETSTDAKHWRDAGTLRPGDSNEPRLFDVKPRTAGYIRVSIPEAAGYYATILSLYVKGKEVAAPLPRAFGGCWTINGVRAYFAQDGAHITGAIETDPPTLIDGGTNGRVARVMWMKGPMWGNAALTATPDSRMLSGLVFHETVDAAFLGAAWFGDRCQEGGAPQGAKPSAILTRTGHWSLFGLAFDGSQKLLEKPSRATLDAIAALIAASPSTRFRLVAHELRMPNPSQNRLRTQARLASLRIALQARGVDLSRVDFVPAGSDGTLPPIVSAVQRLLASRIDLERAAGE